MCIFSFNIIPKGNAKNRIWASFFRGHPKLWCSLWFPFKTTSLVMQGFSLEKSNGNLFAWIPAPNHVANQSWKSCFELFRDPWPLLEVGFWWVNPCSYKAQRGRGQLGKMEWQ